MPGIDKPKEAARTGYTFDVKQRTRLETEVKLHIPNVQRLLHDLRKLGARGGRRVFEENVLYDTAKAELRSAGCLLRIRIETRNGTRGQTDEWFRGILTAKAPPSAPRHARSRYKARIERETDIREPRRWPAMLQSLGFRAGFRYEKLRTSFRLGGLHLDLDETPVGTFLELEGDPKAIDRIAKALGYRIADYVRTNYYGLFAADCRRRGVRRRNMVFRGEKIRKRALFA